LLLRHTTRTANPEARAANRDPQSANRRYAAGLSTVLVASVWLLHGLFNKLLHGSPRHLQIVQSVPGLSGAAGQRVLTAVGLLEVGIALWVFSGWAAHCCAAVQTILLLSMNAIELTVARPLLLWPAGLIPVNLLFLAVAWVAADSRERCTLLTRLRRHPIPIQAHLRDCLTLTYALPPNVLRRLLPPGLELETCGGYAFVAVALVQTESLRPAGLPALMGQDFFLAGYRVFTTFAPASGRLMRGLRILRSDANRARMVVGGNLLTHYNYHRCDASIDRSPDRIHVTVRTHDNGGDLDATADLANAALPAGSPFRSVRDARRFAGPLPFTFDYEQETHAIIAINARRTNWQPAPVGVDVRRISFFEQAVFDGCTPLLAAAFHVKDIDYRWERGVRHALGDKE
jgi:uncharacterized protein YqjF (DUF2071 family)/uncharacterized membrane protein YphA (DoxX/SURF4 family)